MTRSNAVISDCVSRILSFFERFTHWNCYCGHASKQWKQAKCILGQKKFCMCSPLLFLENAGFYY